ncbi:hypothetical protein HBA55_36505 [Pseudomaricurvus alkylphenolicus]|uniref:hypothetical protein n=1 Tax=Pseudomaricurvus alkylphenolicus TaxID=1306991 RepID=UPI0014249BD9|nr:hypothetical protein [Pseudomaricurvus alkylphenolicus]NIB45138.1 hypothetical protein [Pseudomaricurvus alkylphenolicus]
MRTVITIFALLIAGCSDQSEIQELVSSRLKDPDSAKFRNFSVSKTGNRACIEWNAKNSFGGYTKWKFAHFQDVEGTWRIVDPSTYSDRWCTESEADAILARNQIYQPVVSSCSSIDMGKPIAIGDVIEKYRSYDEFGWIDGIHERDRGLLWKVMEIQEDFISAKFIRGEIPGLKHGEVHRFFSSRLYQKHYPEAKGNEQPLQMYHVCKRIR